MPIRNDHASLIHILPEKSQETQLYQGLQGPARSGPWLLPGCVRCVLLSLLHALPTFHLLHYSFCFSDTPGSFLPQGLCICCTAWLLFPASSVCLNVTSSKRPSLVTLSRIVVCPSYPGSLSVSPTRMSTPGGLGLWFVYCSTPQDLEQRLTYSQSSINICGRKERGGREGDMEGERKEGEQSRKTKSVNSGAYGKGAISQPTQLCFSLNFNSF